ncbi:MAG TPA: trehalose-phosphatase [Dermatophilaceae bacterium]
MTDLSPELRQAVAVLAARPRVLIALDFDGTLAPFVLDPLQARAVPGGLEALRAAAALDGVTAGVVSGRDLATLAALTGIGPDDGVTLIGSHGAETNLAAERASLGSDFLDEDAAVRLSMVTAELEAIRSHYPAVRLEHKPSAVVLHTRGVDPSVAAAATTATLEVGQRHPGVHVMPGKNVVELTVVEANKGSAVLSLARATSSEATLYVGDDVTDERAFAALDPAAGDLTVKVGDGETAAGQRIPDPASVVELLELFVSQRQGSTDHQHGQG